MNISSNSHLRRFSQLLLFVLMFSPILCTSASSQRLQWIAQGASPSLHGQVENIDNGEVEGAIEALALDPVNPNIVYVGSVNGGIWKSVNGMTPLPSWQPLTDGEESLSIGSIELDPTDGNHQTVVAGMGRFSSLAQAGGTRSGLLRSTDGGANWTEIGGPVKGLNISGIAPRGQMIVVAANDADDPNNDGIWRTTGGPWVQISGGSSTGLPSGPCSSLASDPSSSARLFANAGLAGLFKSEDTGGFWAKVSNAEMDRVIAGADNIRISVGAAENVYVAIDVSGHLAAVFHSPDDGVHWTAMDLPGLEDGGIHPGGQGAIHLAIAADTTHPNIVYIGGDRQPAKFVNGQETGLDPLDPPQWPNSIGAYDYTGRIFRGDASKPSGNQWVHLTHSKSLGATGGGTAHGSAPHADSRGLKIASNGVLININDGGIYRETSPLDNGGDWYSMNGNLQVTEFHSVAWDSIQHTVIGGAQDTGTPEQQVRADSRWDSISTGDGGVVAVDTVSVPGQSIHYSSFYNLGSFRRSRYDASNQLQNVVYPALVVLNGGAPLDPQFYTPIRLNSVDPTRLIIGGNNAVYESLDQGDTIAEIGKYIVINGNGLNPIAYGAVTNPDMLYVGSGTQVFVRLHSDPSPLVVSSYHGGTVLGIAMDPNHPEIAYVVSPNRVFQTTNAGGSWNDITGNIPVGPGSLRSIAYSTFSRVGALIVGSDMGVYSAPGPSFSNWSPLGVGLPHAPVYHVEYNAPDRIVLVGTLGRGAWTLQLPASSAGIAAANLRIAPSGQDARPQLVAQSRSMAHSQTAPSGGEVPTSPAKPSNSSPPSQLQGGRFQLGTGVVVDPSLSRIYFMDVDGGIKAIDVKTGAAVWTSKDAAKPIGFSGGKLIGQVESGNTANALEIAALDPITGQTSISASASLPPQVAPSIVPNLKGSFSATASGLPNGDTIISWRYAKGTARALPPGTKPTLQSSHGAPPPSAVQEQNLTQGAFRLSAATGVMQSIDASNQPASQTSVVSSEPTGAAQNRKFLSLDGRNYIVSTRIASGADAGDYTLSIYDGQTAARLGQIKSPVAAVPFFVTAFKIVYELGPSVQRTADGLTEQPRSIKCVDLTTGHAVWSAAVRDSNYRGSVPP